MRISARYAASALASVLTIGASWAVADKVYWTEIHGAVGVDRIARANLDGSGFEVLYAAPEVTYPNDIAFDSTSGAMYWEDTGQIFRTGLQGRGTELVAGGDAAGIALDIQANKIYWTTDGEEFWIRRANLDGTDLQDLVWLGARFEVAAPLGIAVDPENGHVYFTQQNAIRRMNRNGTGLVDVIPDVGGDAGFIDVDPERGKIYWTTVNPPMIQRSNLDGSDMEDIVNGLSAPNGIALDVLRGKVYWTDWGRHLIERANLDGTDVQIFAAAAWAPYGVALDIDCGNGLLDAGEMCDIAIPGGTQGACPTACNDTDPCTLDLLVQAGTCTTHCEISPITTPLDGDGCCPAGANANNDNDCEPVCPNGECEPGEDADICVQDCGVGIPTVTEWGIGVMALLLLTAARIQFGRRCRVSRA